MYKTRNTRMGNGTRGIRGVLYSGECCQTFREMSSNIPENVFKHSGECPQTFWGISSNIWENVHIPGNVAKHSDECPQTIKKILENSLGHVVKHLRKVLKPSDECT